MGRTKAEKVYAIHSVYGEGPEGKRCRGCAHFLSFLVNRRWYKCEAYGVSCSEATDWGGKWPACGLYTEDMTRRLYPERRMAPTVIDRLKHQPYLRPREPEIPGQMTIEEIEREGLSDGKGFLSGVPEQENVCT